MHLFGKDREIARAIPLKTLALLLGVAATPGHAVAGENYMDAYKRWGESFIGKPLEDITCIPDTTDCRIPKRIKEFEGFQYSGALGTVSKGANKGDTISVIFGLNARKITSVDFAVHYYPETFLSRGFRLHWNLLSPDGFFEVLGRVSESGKSTEAEIHKLMLDAGLFLHRKIEKDGKLHIQYARPAFPKGSLIERTGGNMSPDVIWIADFIFENNKMIEFSRKPTGWADSKLLGKQIRERFYNSTTSDKH